jgi:hypothetical protein
MKKRKDFRSQLPLADMHADGVRFDPKILQALKKQQAGQQQGNQQASQ